MSYIEIIGVVTSADFIVAEATAFAATNIPDCNFTFNSRAMNKKEYDREVKKLRKRNGWRVDIFLSGERSVLAWRELPSKGGLKDIIGGFSHLMEFFYEMYGVTRTIEYTLAEALIRPRVEMYLERRMMCPKMKRRKVVVYGEGSENTWRSGGLLCRGLFGLAELQDDRDGGLELVLFDRKAASNRQKRLVHLAADLNKMVSPCTRHRVTVYRRRSIEEALHNASVLIVLEPISSKGADDEETTEKRTEWELQMNKAEMFELGGALAATKIPHYLKVVFTLGRWAWFNATFLAEVCRSNGARISKRNIVAVTAHMALEPLAYLCQAKSLWVGDVEWPRVWGLPGTCHAIDVRTLLHRVRNQAHEAREKPTGLPVQVKLRQRGTYRPQALAKLQSPEEAGQKDPTSEDQPRPWRPWRALPNRPDTWRPVNMAQTRNTWKYVAHHKEIVSTAKSGQWCYLAEVRATLDLLTKWFDKKRKTQHRPTSLAMCSDGGYGFWSGLYVSQPAVLRNGTWWRASRRGPGWLRGGPQPSPMVTRHDIHHAASTILRRHGVGYTQDAHWIFQFGGLSTKSSIMHLTANKRREDMYGERPSFYGRGSVDDDDSYKVCLWERTELDSIGCPLKPARKKEHLPPLPEGERKQSIVSNISSAESDSLVQTWSEVYKNGFEDEFGFTLYWSLIQMSLIELLMQLELYEAFRKLATAITQKRKNSGKKSEEIDVDLGRVPILEKIIRSSQEEERELRRRTSEQVRMELKIGKQKTVVDRSWADEALEKCLEEEVIILSQIGYLWKELEGAAAGGRKRTLVGKSLVESMRQQGLRVELEALRQLALNKRSQLTIIEGKDPREGTALAMTCQQRSAAIGSYCYLEDDYAAEYLAWMAATARQQTECSLSSRSLDTSRATPSIESHASPTCSAKEPSAKSMRMDSNGDKKQKYLTKEKSFVPQYDIRSTQLPNALITAAVRSGLRKANRCIMEKIDREATWKDKLPPKLTTLPESTSPTHEPGSPPPERQEFDTQCEYLQSAVKYWKRWVLKNCLPRPQPILPTKVYNFV